ncbi:MAG: hypothetical protein RLZZ522_1432 [Verrucomicrobiota bacterium]
MSEADLNEPAAAYRVVQTAPTRVGWTIKTFDSLEAAELADRRQNHAMSVNERLIITEQLRATYYGYAETGIEPRLEGIVKSIRLQ